MTEYFGIPIPEFVALVNVITTRHGKGVMIQACDKEMKMHFSNDKKHLGYIDLKTGSLVWDKTE